MPIVSRAVQTTQSQFNGAENQTDVAGSNLSITTTVEDIWAQGGVLVFPTSAAVIATSSSSADDAAAGTGIQQLTFTGLDANWNTISETITMNGTSI